MAAGDQGASDTGTDNNSSDTTPTEIDPEVREQLLGARRSIDNIDAALIHLLAERFKYTQQVGRLKATKGLPASDPSRERDQIGRLRLLAEESHLDPAFAEKWFNFVVAEVIHHHEQFASGSEPESESSSD
jgi:chorismate mutase